MLNGCFDVILPHKKSSWTDFGGIYTHIPPSLRPWARNNLLSLDDVDSTCSIIHVSIIQGRSRIATGVYGYIYPQNQPK